MPDIYIQADWKNFEKYLTALERVQIPYASAVALTKLAAGAQEKIRREMPEHFTLRARRRMLAGVRTTSARKSDFSKGTQHSEVKDIDTFMGIHTTGGTKKTVRHKYLSVPTEQYLDEGIRGSSGAIKRTFKPASLFKKIAAAKRGQKRRKGQENIPLPFVIEKGAGRFLLVRREGKAPHPLKFLYQFGPDAKIEKRWPFQETVQDFVSRNAEFYFARAIDQALATAK